MKKIVWLVLLMCAGSSVFGSVQDSLVKGNAWYNKGEFKKAISAYAFIVEAGYESDVLYYNLGNAYYKNGQIGESILNYERALRLNPGLEDAEQNLQIAGQSTVDRFEVLPEPLLRAAYKSIYRLFSPSVWSVIGLLFLLFCIASVAVYFFTPNKRIGFILSASALLLFLFSLGMAYQHHYYKQNNKAAIVMKPSSYAKSGPSKQAEDVFILHEGTKVNVIESFQTWQKVRLPDGKIGWISKEDLALIKAA